MVLCMCIAMDTPESTFNINYYKNNYIMSMQNLYENDILHTGVG